LHKALVGNWMTLSRGHPPREGRGDVNGGAKPIDGIAEIIEVITRI
jgi:hypothetical protein